MLNTGMKLKKSRLTATVKGEQGHTPALFAQLIGEKR
jgi:hypothetical protein